MRIKSISKCYFLYGVACVSYFLIALFAKNIIEISLHDSYFIFNTSQLYFAIAFVVGMYFLIGLVMAKNNKPLNLLLSYAHLIISIALNLILVLRKQPHPKELEYTDFNPATYFSNPTIEVMNNFNDWTLILLIILLAAQLLFIINVIHSFFRRVG